MDIREIRWSQMAQDRDQWWDLVNTTEPPGSMKDGDFLD